MIFKYCWCFFLSFFNINALNGLVPKHISNLLLRYERPDLSDRLEQVSLWSSESILNIERQRSVFMRHISGTNSQKTWVQSVHLKTFPLCHCILFNLAQFIYTSRCSCTASVILHLCLFWLLFHVRLFFIFHLILSCVSFFILS